MNETTKAYNDGEFFADYDKETEMWGIFHTEYKQGHCFGLFVSERFAEKNAEKRNEEKREIAEFDKL